MNELLSLATFQPHYAHPPYLNSPRSIEACRRHGVKPIELVETPYDEFRRKYPSEDDETVLRRYERFDCARQRVLGAVLSEWKKLSESGWKPPEHRSMSPNESIIDVDPRAHSTLLEIQAQRFRKIEENEWNMMQKLLFRDIRDAAEDLKHKEILKKHEQITRNIENDQGERRRQIEATRREILDQKKRIEEQRMGEIKLSQIRAANELKEKEAEEKESRKLMNELKNQHDTERNRRHEFARKRKEAILDKMEGRLEDRVQQYELRERENAKRLVALEKRKEIEREQRRSNRQDKIAQARAEAEAMEKERITRMVTLGEDLARRVEEHHAQNEAQRRQLYEAKRITQQEKLQRFRENSDFYAASKVEKVLQDMEKKEDATRKQFERIEEARLRRQRIKQIRYETYCLTASRRKQAYDSYIQKLEEDIKYKDERVEAIKTGSQVLSRLRFAVSEGLGQTKNRLREEVGHLRHADRFTPSNVIGKARAITDEVLFPSIQRTAGSFNPPLSAKPSLDSGSLSEALNGKPGTDSFNWSDGEEDVYGVSADSPSYNRAATAPSLQFRLSSQDEFGKSSESFSKTLNSSTLGGSSRGRDQKRKYRVIPLRSLSPEKVNSVLEELPSQVDRSLASSRVYSRGGTRKDFNNGSSRGQLASSYGSAGDDSFQKSGRGRGGGVLAQSSLVSDSDNDEEDDDDDIMPGLALDFRQQGGLGTTGSVGNGSQRSLTDNESRMVERSTSRSVDSGERGGSARSRGTYSSLKSRSSIRKNGHGHGGDRGHDSDDRDDDREHSIDHMRLSAISRDSARSLRGRPDPRSELEALRREQNAALLTVLEEERIAEADRERASKVLGPTELQERRQLDLVFAEERKRASERIIALTKLHEERIREAILSLDKSK